MRKSRFTESQLVGILKDGEAGVCSQEFAWVIAGIFKLTYKLLANDRGKRRGIASAQRRLDAADVRDRSGTDPYLNVIAARC